MVEAHMEATQVDNEEQKQPFRPQASALVKICIWICYIWICPIMFIYLKFTNHNKTWWLHCRPHLPGLMHGDPIGGVATMMIGGHGTSTMDNNGLGTKAGRSWVFACIFSFQKNQLIYIYIYIIL